MLNQKKMAIVFFMRAVWILSFLHVRPQASINLALWVMLQGTGIESYPLLVASSSYARVMPSIPSFNQFNSLIIIAYIDNNPYLLDASFQFSKPNLIPSELYNGMGLLWEEKEYRWLHVASPNSYYQSFINLGGELHENGDLNGQITARLDGYSARKIRLLHSQNHPLSKIIQQTLIQNDDRFIIDSEKAIHMSDPDDSLTITFDFHYIDYASIQPWGMEFRPMILGYLYENPFQKEKRTLPIVFDAPERLKFDVNLTIPSPLILKIELQDRQLDFGNAKLIENYYSSSNNQIHYAFEISLYQNFYPSSTYDQVKTLYQQWVKLSEKVWVFEKKE